MKVCLMRRCVHIFLFIATAFIVVGVAYGSSNVISYREELVAYPTSLSETKALPKRMQVTGEVIQNKAFAHLDIVGDIATIIAGFAHPDNLDEEVMLVCSLYAWNAGEDRVTLQENISEIAFNYVEVNFQLSVLNYDYYSLICKNRLRNIDEVWSTLFITYSRYSRIAPYNGIWERTGEVTSSSAILHTYLTEKPAFNATDVDSLNVPPMAGYAQFIVYSDPNLHDIVKQSGFYPVDDYIQVEGEWRRVNYNFRWTVTGLVPDTTYYYVLETQASDGVDSFRASNVNSFRTAPDKNSEQPVVFVVTHCLDPFNTAYEDPSEAAERGLKVFDSMLTYGDQSPDFVIMQGDTVYYDGGAGYAPEVGLYPYFEYIWRWLYWYSQYQFDNSMYFFQQVPGYWMVDDHDYWENNINEPIPDGWYIFRNVNPTPGEYGTAGESAIDYYNNNPYQTSQGNGSQYWRSVRWGRNLEIFIEEGRNLRDEDASLIWGDEQREWLEQRIRASDATFKIIAVTTPMLGPVVPDDMYPEVTPDKHANQKFRMETELFLDNIKDVENIFIVAGDRHYKYHSMINSENFPEVSNFNEFGSGSAAAPPHAITGGIPDSDLAVLLFSDGTDGIGASAGYLWIEVSQLGDWEEITFKLISVTEDKDNDVVYQKTFSTFKLYETFLPLIIIRR